MLLQELTLHNFLPYAHETVKFQTNAITSITAEFENSPLRSNGAGKSSLLESITYALFGVSRTSSELDLVKQNSDGEMYVELKFDFSNQAYVIRRGRTKSGSPILFFSVNGNTLGDGIRDIDAQIVKSLGMSYDVFIATCFFKQNQIDTFTIATPSKRKEYLSSILNLSFYDFCHSAAKKLRDELSSDLDRKQGGIQQLVRIKTEKEAADNYEFVIRKNEDKKSEINKKLESSTLNLREVTESIINFESQLKASSEIIGQFNTAKGQHSQKVGVIVKLSQDIEAKKISLRQQWDRKTLVVKNLPELKTKKESLTKRLEEVQEKKKTDEWASNIANSSSDLKIKEGELSGRVKSFKAEILSLSGLGSQCSTCKQIIDKNTLTKIIKAKEDQIEKDTKEIEVVRNNIKNLNQEYQDDQKIKDQIREIKSLIVNVDNEIKIADSAEKERGELEVEGKVQLKSLEDLLESSSAELKQIDIQVSDLRIKVETMPKVELGDSVEKLKGVGIALQKNIDSFNADIREYERLITRAKLEIEEIGKLSKQIEQENVAIKGTQDEVQVYQELAEVFSQRGIPAIIIENTVVEIETIANELLQELGSVFKLKLQSQKETKKGDLKETLDVLIEGPEGVRDYATYSGGEKTIINVCLRLALSTILSSRNKVHFDSIYLDEVVSSLDEEGRENLLRMMKLLTNRFSQIFIISHISEIKDIFPHKIKIVKTSSGSKIYTER